MGFMDSLFGGTEQASTQTREQRALLKQQAALQQQSNAQAYSTLNGIASNPDNAYEYNADNGAAAFKAGVINPALQQLNQQIGNNQHSSMLHSSANMYGQNQLKQNTMNNLNNLQYQDNLQQQQMKQQGKTDAYSRQLQSLGQLMGGNASVLGTQAVSLQKKPGIIDGITAATGAASGIMSLM
jgi:hypothetical protein